MSDDKPNPDERPQYTRVGDLLRDRIKSGVYPVGGLLPTEGDLRAEFSISRHTIREALRRMADDGLIERRQGSGSRVIAAEPHQNYVHEMRSLDQLFQYASDTRFVIASVGMATPEASDFPPVTASGDPWLIVKGLRLERDEDIRICHSMVFINRVFAAIAEDLRRGTGAIYRRIEERFNVEVFEVVQDITVVAMPPEAARALDLPPQATAVRVARRYLSADGTVMLASVNHHPAERFSYSMQLRREARRGGTV